MEGERRRAGTYSVAALPRLPRSVVHRLQFETRNALGVSGDPLGPACLATACFELI
jgi:hypothetical protein